MCSPGIDGQPVDGSFIDTSDSSALVQINKSKTEGGCLVASWLSVLVWNHQCGNRLNSLFPWCDSNVFPVFFCRTPNTLYILWRSSSDRAKRWGCTSARATASIEPTASSSPASPSRALSTTLDVSGYYYLHVSPCFFLLFSRYFVSYVISQQTTPHFDVLHTFFHSIPVGWSVNIRSTTTTIYLALFSLSLSISLCTCIVINCWRNIYQRHNVILAMHGCHPVSGPGLRSPLLSSLSLPSLFYFASSHCLPYII